MSDYRFPTQMHINTQLFSAKRNELKSLIANLQLNEVKEDEQFKNTVQKIKNATLLKPVVFDEPTINKNTTSTKEVGPNYNNPFGGKITLNVITVEFKFTGSSELFEYLPSNGMSFGGSNIRVFQPIGKSVFIDVELSSLDKELTIREAKAKMDLTRNVIAGNNSQLEPWNTSIEADIDSMAAAKRTELIKFYS